MSRTIRNRHKRGRDYTIDIAADIAWTQLGAQEKSWCDPEKLAKYRALDIRYNARLHRDGFFTRGWKKGFKEESAKVHRAHWRQFFDCADWDRPYPHLDEAADIWSWD